MKIEQSAIYMSSVHQIKEQYGRTEKLEAWIAPPPETTQGRQEDRIILSRQVSDRFAASMTKTQETYNLDDADKSLSPNLSMIKRLIELFTGNEINITDLSNINKNTSPETSDCCTDADEPVITEAQSMQGWGARYDLQESYSESEQTSVSIQGIIQTVDGQEMTFNLNLQMERSFLEQNNVSIRLGTLQGLIPW